MDWWKSDLRKISLRRLGETAFLTTFLLIWLPRAIPIQSIIAFLWPIYHWYGVDYYIPLVKAPGVLIGSILACFVAGFVREYVADSKAIAKIPTRIHVTGIRGKTTTTRLIGAALRNHGWRVVTKTTGKAATLIDPEGTERGIRGHHEQPNLREQPRIIESVADAGGADAIVFECMAIRPKNMIAESKFVRSTISVITNVRADHLDVMGPSLEDVAWNLSGIVPSNGVVVTAEKRYIPIIRKRAEEKNAKVIEVDTDTVPDENLSKFPYMIFKENIAIALKVCELLKVPPDEALKGMLDAKPDPGLTRILNSVIANHDVRLIAAFGVNDVESTRLVFQELSRRRVIEEPRMLVGMFHAREDRVTRTLEFAEVMARMPFEKILVVGEMTNLFVGQATREGYAKEKIVNLGTVDPPAIMDFISKMSLKPDQGLTLFGCGNMIGIEDFIDAFEKLSEKQDSHPMESRN
ncbi:poly-gamma-glutamate synthase PgsB [Candidatus Bathyarchaeota archaeon]|nr:MAG: poly-gamma-glutamate synthase PgsB [Candidatus Bathyarchaeota archaeon]